MGWTMRFLGVGNASAVELGSACAVVEHGSMPLLMIDCGQEAMTAYLDTYGEPPSAVFITHVHLDHVAGMERLFVDAFFNPARRGRVRLYVPVTVLPHLQARVADYPGVLAEGGANFWDAFQLVPVRTGFWHERYWFEVFAVRHHLPETAWGLRLPGSFVYTGDTRPIPEVLARHADAGEFIAHDCALHGNPSHSGIDDLEREYSPELLARLALYHYASADEAQALRERGHRVLQPGECVALPSPRDPRAPLPS